MFITRVLNIIEEITEESSKKYLMLVLEKGIYYLHVILCVHNKCMYTYRKRINEKKLFFMYIYSVLHIYPFNNFNNRYIERYLNKVLNLIMIFKNGHN